MKKSKTIPCLSILAGIALLGFATAPIFGIKWQFGKSSLSNFIHPKAATLQASAENRASITFLLGEDKDSTNGYYAEAEKFYRTHPTERTEAVVTHCRSLLAMQDYLIRNKPANGLPWGRVNLVVHGNEWSGLAVPVLPKGSRTTAAALQNVVGNKAFFPFPDIVADACTEFRIEGCGVGRDTLLLQALRQAFGGKGAQPKVISSPHFIHFSSEKKQGQPMLCRREMLDAWYTFYPKTYRPEDAELVRRLKKTYPDTDLDWQAALNHAAPGRQGEAYWHEFDVPVVWVVAYPDEQSLPDLAKWRAQQSWLDEQPELQQVLKDYGMPREHFQWTFLTSKHQLADGTEKPAIRAIGLCTVLTVLKPVEGT